MKILLFIFTLLTTFSVHAQNPVIKDTIFLDNVWLETPYRSAATYFRGAWYNADDSTWLVLDYYIENNSIQMVGHYKKKIRPQNQIGEFKYYYKNGNLRALYFYKDGFVHGKSILYYENGKPEISRTFENGRLKDTVYSYYENGNTREIKVVNSAYNAEDAALTETEFILLDYYHSDGTHQVVNGTGAKIEYYSNGLKKVTIQYQDGFPHGEWVQYDEKKKVISKMTFKNGKFISGIMYPKKKKDIFASLYREPRFPGGVKELDAYLQRNTGKCKEAFQNEIIIMIRVNENGVPEFDQVISGDVTHCQYEELTDLVNKMPTWTPAIRYGRYVEATYVIRVK